MMIKQRMHKMSLIMALAILFTTVQLPIAYVSAAVGDKTTLDISHGNITIGIDTVSSYNETGDLLETVDPDGYLITGSTTENTITVTGGTHDIVLSDVNIDLNAAANACALSIQKDAVVNLTLNGSNTLTSGENKAGLQVPDGASVVIGGSGSLATQGGTYGAGIGGGRAQSGGSITIAAGNVTSTGGSRGAGIGGGGNINGSNGGDRNNGGPGGAGGNGGSIAISGGNVTAQGGTWGAGIGGGGGGIGGASNYWNGTGGSGGAGGNSGSVTITGGDVTTSGGERGAGIGGGGGGDGGYGNDGNGGNGGAGGSNINITISGGDVAATGAYSGAGIGSGGYGGGGGRRYSYDNAGSRGSGGAVGVILISNAALDAQGGEYSAGIGGGAAGISGEITINNAIVNAKSISSASDRISYGAGIGGGGISGNSGTISITDSNIDALSQSGAAIGGGSGGRGDTININGGNVIARSQNGAGIGGGSNGSGGEITITTATIDTQSSSNGAGIGGGSGSSGVTTIIQNSIINARSQSGAGIGSGLNGNSGTISINESNVTAQSQNGSGIGGNGGSGNTITVDSSFVTAQSQNASGIGGAGGTGKVIIIIDSEVNAYGGSNGAGIGGGNGGEITITNSTIDAQSSSNGAGIGGGTNGSGGIITINSGNVKAGSQYGAGIGGGSGSNGRNGDNMTSGGDGSGGSTGGAGGLVTINGGVVSASSLIGAGIGGGAGGAGGKGGNGTSGGDGARGGNGGNGGKIIINGGFVTVPGVNSISIDGGKAGSGGTGGMKTSGGIGGNGGNGGSGGEIIITSGTIAPSGIGNNNGIGGGNGGNGGNGGDAAAGTFERRPSGSAGAAAILTSCVVTGGSANARIGCIPTTGGDTTENVYFTTVNLEDASEEDVTVLSLSQGSTIPYGIKDVSTDIYGKLYLYLPAFEGDTTALITAGGTIYNGYHGQMFDTATFADPNVLKMDQSVFSFTDSTERTITFGEELVLDYTVSGGTLVGGSVAYTYSGMDFSTGETVTDMPFLPVNAGNYTLKATLPGDDFYHDAAAAKSFFITPKSIAGFTVADISPIIYTGVAGKPLVDVRDGDTDLTTGTDFSVDCLEINAGSATALITGRGNYQGTLSKAFQIVPKDITLVLSAVPDEAKAGSNVALTAAVLGTVDIPDGTVTFKYNDDLIAQDAAIIFDGSSYSAATTWNNVPAGEYNITAAYMAAENDNYTCISNGLVSDFSITKYEQPDFRFVDGTDYAINEGIVSKTYDDNSFLLQTDGKLSGGSVSYSVFSGNDVISLNEASGEVSFLKSGTAVIRALSPSDEIFNEASNTVIISIARADQSGFGFADTTIEKTYGDESFAVAAAGGQSTGEIVYSVKEGSDVISVNEATGEVSILKSGTAVITAAKAADDCYNETSAQLTISVDKATPVIINSPIAADISVKGIISSSTLSDGEASIPGSFSWTDSNHIVSSSGTYEVTFIPEDTVNYYSNTCEVKVQVTHVIAHKGTGIQFDLSQTVLPERAISVDAAVSVEPASGKVFSIVNDIANSDPDYTADVLSIYDFALIDQNGDLITDFTGTITVKIPIQGGMSGDLRVMWYEPVSNKLADMNARLEEGYLVFETTHFSYYAIMQMTEIMPLPVKVPVTGEAGSQALIILLMLLSIVIVSRTAVFFKVK